MSLPVDGTQDHELRVKGISQLQVGDWRSENQSGELDTTNVDDLRGGFDREPEELEYDHRI